VAADGSRARLKLETLQPTGSFKLRGATNAIASLSEAGTVSIVTASSGNHGIAVAAAARSARINATILVGRTIPEAKLNILRRYEDDLINVEVLDCGSDEAELVARERASRSGWRYLPPYNDPLVIAGQGTAAVELLEQWPECNCIIAPIGGGGLIAGLAVWAKAIDPTIRLIGVQPKASATFARLLSDGGMSRLEIGATLADGAAGNVEPGSITIELCRRLVDQIAVVDEEAIADAIRWAFSEHRLVLEGSAALGIAALRQGEADVSERRRIAVVITGQLIDTHTFVDLLATK